MTRVRKGTELKAILWSDQDTAPRKEKEIIQAIDCQAPFTFCVASHILVT